MITTINNKHNKLNVPNLRFPEFQGEWEKHELGDICETITDFVAAGSFASLRENVKYYQEDNYAQLVRTVDLKKDFTNNDFVYVDEFAYDFLWRVQLKEPNIVLPNIGANIGEKYYVSPEDLPKEKNVLGPNAILLRSKCNDTHFVYFRLSTSSYDNEMKKLVGASGQPKFNKTDLKKVRLFMPSLKEQKKISHFLGLLDERIATQNKIIDKLQSLIKGLNDFLYTQYGGEVLTSFTELGTSYSGLSGKSAQDFGSGKPFITYLNVYSNNVIKENDFQYVAIKDDEKQNVVKYGDVLFTLSSETPEEVGVGSVYLGKEKVYLNSFCFGIHITNTEVAFSPYLSYYVSLTAFRKFIYPYAQGSTRFNLCKADFEKASIKLPTLENQKRIYLILGHIDCKIETERQLLALYNSQKQYLLRQMFI